MVEQHGIQLTDWRCSGRFPNLAFIMVEKLKFKIGITGESVLSIRFEGYEGISCLNERSDEKKDFIKHRQVQIRLSRVPPAGHLRAQKPSSARVPPTLAAWPVSPPMAARVGRRRLTRQTGNVSSMTELRSQRRISWAVVVRCRSS